MANKNNPLTLAHRRKLAEFNRKRRPIKTVQIETHDRSIYGRRPKFIKALGDLREMQIRLDELAESDFADDLQIELDHLRDSINQIRRKSKKRKSAK